MMTYLIEVGTWLSGYQELRSESAEIAYITGILW